MRKPLPRLSNSGSLAGFVVEQVRIYSSIWDIELVDDSVLIMNGAEMCRRPHLRQHCRSDWLTKRTPAFRYQ
jgi:hypothetical protein